jgi:hypothetical protein
MGCFSLGPTRQEIRKLHQVVRRRDRIQRFRIQNRSSHHDDTPIQGGDGGPEPVWFRDAIGIDEGNMTPTGMVSA